MAQFEKAFLDRLRHAVAISDLIALTVQWDKQKSRPAKRDYWAPCPLHHEKSASFHAEDDKGRYHCFGCQASGDHFEWLQHKNGLSFFEAVKHLADLAGIEVPAMRPVDAEVEARRGRLVEIMGAADRWFRGRWKLKSGGTKSAAEYLKKRGVTGETAQAFGIGYAPKSGLLAYLREAGFRNDDMIGAGLAGKSEHSNAIYERFRDRIIFPIHDARGRVIGFGGRAMKPDAKVSKYLNSPETDLYDKSRTLFNLYRARPIAAATSEMLVVEGYLDAIALHQQGHTSVVATCGVALTTHHLEQIWRQVSSPVLCFDGDGPGVAAAARTVDLALAEIRPDQTVRIATLSPGKDPDDMMKTADGRAEFNACIVAALPLHDVVWQRLIDGNDRTTPERSAAFERDLAEQLAVIKNGEVRPHYVRVFEERCNTLTGRKSNLAKAMAKVQQVGRKPAPVTGQNAIAGASEGKTSKRGAGDEILPPGMIDDDAANLECANMGLTDMANAWRFIRRNGHRFMYTDELGWMAYDGRRWKTKGAYALVRKAVVDTVMHIKQEAASLMANNQDQVYGERKGETIWLSDALLTWCLSSQAATKVRCIADLASPDLTVQPDLLDQDPFKLCVLNGTLHFDARYEKFFDFRPHDQTDLITKLAPVTYDPTAPAAVYDKFMAQVQPDQGDRDYLHTVGGLCLTGDATNQALWFFYGGGSNGKSSLLEVWAGVMGDYAQSVPISTFLDGARMRSGAEATPHLVDLAGARMVRASEPAKRSKLSEDLIKEVTGGENMRVRQLNKPFFDFKPEFKLIISGNHKPQIEGADEGIWRRMKLVPWPVSISKEDRDLQLVNKMMREKSGVLNRLIAGLQQYFLEGLVESKTVQDATATWRDDSDPLGRFLADCVITTNSDDDRVPAMQLYQLYQVWCEANTEHVWKAAGFGKALRDRGFIRRKASTISWLGVRLIRSVDDFGGQSASAVKHV